MIVKFGKERIASNPKSFAGSFFDLRGWQNAFVPYRYCFERLPSFFDLELRGFP